MKARTGWQMAALCTVPFIMVLGNSMLIPVLPEMRQSLDLTKFQESLAITAFSVPAGLVILIAGYLSDHFGRKKVIVPSMILYAIGGVISGLAAWLLQSYLLVLGGRVIQGIGAAGTMPVAMALVGDLFQSKERSKALGLLEASNGIGKVLSPILGSFVGLLAWWAVFFGYAAVTVPAILAVLFVVKEPKGKKAKGGLGKYFKSVGKIFAKKGKSLVTAIWAGTVVLFVLFGILFYISELLEKEYGIDGIPKGLVLAVPLLAMASTAYFTGGYLQKHVSVCKAAVATGFGLGTAGLLGASLLGSDWAFYTGIILNGIGSGLVLTSLNTLITSAAGKEERGAVTAVYGAVRFFGVALGPPIFTRVMDWGYTVPFWFSAGLEAVTALAAIFLINPKQLLGDKNGGDSKKSKDTKAKVERWQPPKEAHERSPLIRD